MRRLPKSHKGLAVWAEPDRDHRSCVLVKKVIERRLRVDVFLPLNSAPLPRGKWAVRVLLCKRFGLMDKLPTATPEGHWCTVGIDWDPRCHDEQRDIMTERQPCEMPHHEKD